MPIRYQEPSKIGLIILILQMIKLTLPDYNLKLFAEGTMLIMVEWELKSRNLTQKSVQFLLNSFAYHSNQLISEITFKITFSLFDKILSFWSKLRDHV